jgi:hypothetical protein
MSIEKNQVRQGVLRAVVVSIDAMEVIHGSLSGIERGQAHFGAGRQ